MSTELRTNGHAERSALVKDLTGQQHLNRSTPSRGAGWDVRVVVGRLAATATRQPHSVVVTTILLLPQNYLTFLMIGVRSVPPGGAGQRLRAEDGRAVMAELGSHAVVLGAGVAGLLTARVLSDFYWSVTVVERDVLPDRPGQRRGIPQGRHLHNFLSRGTRILGELFPGLLDELVTAGAVVDDGRDLSRLYVRVAGYEINPTGALSDPASLAAYQASRPFMEFHLRRRVSALGNVRILEDHDALAPVITADAVTGVRILHRVNDVESTVDADLVVDATGRAARTRGVLDDHGFGHPREDRIPSACGYSSQLMRIAPAANCPCGVSTTTGPG